MLNHSGKILWRILYNSAWNINEIEHVERVDKYSFYFAFLIYKIHNKYEYYYYYYYGPAHKWNQVSK